ncbi:MAG: bifunctional UDP-N-acetylglucosamine diphosphorylase/glucosamine-1-phosphate N-acetyltransferase GlmU [Thermodesulfobacteriota bacterium]|nr:bifunctional UDP-N-acetylglucosamine diphosphorylase/glucosamine-1-phosphate N-acetyltransferase GlmU [Thermodesulfobacteriota bacterium]
MKEIATVILAAGKGKRMKSRQVKVLHPLMGVPVLSFPIEVAKKVLSRRIIVVVGHQGKLVRKRFEGEGLVFAEQKEQLGTGHAVLCAREALKDFKGDILILCGDVPLITDKTIQRLIEVHQKECSRVTVLTTEVENPKGYGRIIQDGRGNLLRIVEEKDATDQEREVKEVNTGIYCMDADYAFYALQLVDKNNTQGEYYLTDVIDIASKEKEKARGFLTEDPSEVMGINDRADLARVSGVIKEEILRRLMIEGVTISDPLTTYIERNVTIGKETTIYPNNSIKSGSAIGEECTIEQGCTIKNSKIGNRVVVKSCSVIYDSVIYDDATIGPFIYLGPEAEVEAKAKTGSFIEVKKTRIER